MPTAQFIWDELSDNLLIELDNNGELLAEYTHQPNQFGELISEYQDTETNYFHFDGLGSTRQITDASQTVDHSYAYSGFGETVASTGVGANRFQYKGAFGYCADEQSQYYYVRRRSLLPGSGRWLSRDPLNEGTMVQQPYTYSANSPIDFVDPTGEAEQLASSVTNRVTASNGCEDGECVIVNDFGSPTIDDCGFDGHAFSDNWTWGFKFSNRFEFGGDCECCEYRQYILEKEQRIHVLNAADEIIWTCEVSVYTGEAKEDCLSTGRCYGHRDQTPNWSTDQYLRDRPTGCWYRMYDLPSIKIVNAVKQCRANVGRIPDGAAEFVLISNYRFLVNVINTCDANTVIWSAFVEKDCKGGIGDVRRLIEASKR